MIDSIRFYDIPNLLERPPVTDTMRWINYANAILTIVNGGDIERFAGGERNPDRQLSARDGLRISWGITDSASADEALTRLRETGHRAGFLELVRSDPLFELTSEEFQLVLTSELDDYDPDDAILRHYLENLYYTYREFGDRSLLAWDYVRAINILKLGYLSGIFSFEEALDKSLEFALALQQAYSSWDDLYRNFLAGFHFWSPDNINNPNAENYRRIMIWRGIALIPDGPSSLPWDTPLIADWPEQTEPGPIYQFYGLILDIIAPIDTNIQHDTTYIDPGTVLYFPITADMFQWIGGAGGQEGAGVNLRIFINEEIAAGYQSSHPHIIRDVAIVETQHGYIMSSVRVTFADEFAHSGEFEATIYLTRLGTRSEASEITIRGVLRG